MGNIRESGSGQQRDIHPVQEARAARTEATSKHEKEDAVVRMMEEASLGAGLSVQLLERALGSVGSALKIEDEELRKQTLGAAKGELERALSGAEGNLNLIKKVQTERLSVHVTADYPNFSKFQDLNDTLRSQATALERLIQNAKAYQSPYREMAPVKANIKTSVAVLLIPMIGVGLSVALSGVMALNQLPFGQMAQRSEARLSANRASADEYDSVFYSALNLAFQLCDQTKTEHEDYLDSLWDHYKRNGNLNPADYFTDGPNDPYRAATLSQCKQMGWQPN